MTLQPSVITGIAASRRPGQTPPGDAAAMGAVTSAATAAVTRERPEQGGEGAAAAAIAAAVPRGITVIATRPTPATT